MTNNIRVFLWLGLALALWLNYSQWQMDYGPKPTSTANGAISAANQPSEGDTVPEADQNPTAPAIPAAGEDIPTAPAPAQAASQPAVESVGKIRVTTDVLVLDIDLRGGTLIYAELPGYPITKGQPEPVILFNQASPETNYVLLSGLGGSPADAAPSHLSVFRSAADRYALTPGQDELRVPLTWTDGKGVTVTKTFVFHRSMFTIGLEYAIDNQSAAPFSVLSYARIKRSDPPVERSMFKVESFASRGPAIWAIKKNDDEHTYHKLNIEKPDEIKDFPPVAGGWLAGMQHHFVSAIVPDATKPYTFSLSTKGREYILGAV